MVITLQCVKAFLIQGRINTIILKIKICKKLARSKKTSPLTPPSKTKHFVSVSLSMSPSAGLVNQQMLFGGNRDCYFCWQVFYCTDLEIGPMVKPQLPRKKDPFPISILLVDTNLMLLSEMCHQLLQSHRTNTRIGYFSQGLLMK